MKQKQVGLYKIEKGVNHVQCRPIAYKYLITRHGQTALLPV